MPKVDIYDLQNQKVGDVELSDAVFGADVNEHLLYESVRHYLASARSGTAKTKNRWEVAGSGKKLWRHGATTHGPQPRDYSYHLNKKMLTGALRSALSAKLRDGELKVVSAFTFADHKTKSMASALETLEAKRSVLLVNTIEPNRNLDLGSRNLPGVKLVATKDVTTYDLLAHKFVVISEAAAKKLSEALS